MPSLAIRLFREARGHFSTRRARDRRGIAYAAGVVNTLLWLSNEGALNVRDFPGIERAARKLARTMNSARS